MPRPTPFDYTATREYFADAYAFRKAQWSGFSHRYVAQKTNTSSGYLSRILNGSLRLSESKIDAFAKVFDLTHEESSYLSLLLRTEEAEGEAKVTLFRELLAARGIRLQVLEGESFGLYGAWYLPVLREALALIPSDWTDAQIGALLRPALSAELVAEARQRLIDLEMLTEIPERGLKRSERLLSSGDRPQLALRHYADACLALARRALVEEELTERELSFVTLSVSEKTRALILEKMRALRREILELAATENAPDRVIQVQLHTLPTSSSWANTPPTPPGP
jgi:uncharacterized protein (TIGR02147 family)